MRISVLTCLFSALILSSGGAQAATINIVAGPGLAANAPALGAFNRAAAQWEQHLADPITVRVEADLFDLGAGIVNETFVEVDFRSYKTEIRPALIADSQGQPKNEIVSFLPTGENDDPLEVFLPDGFTPTLTSQVPTANLKALGLTPSYPDDNPTEADGFIDINTFSGGIDFDFDNSDGVGGMQTDFETFAAREIGHVLGFYSDANFIDMVLGGLIPPGDDTVALTTMDLFRFRDGNDGSPPTNNEEFNSFARSLHASNNEVFGDGSDAWRLSSGEFDGDGNRSDTWKDNALVDPDNPPIGIMDPNIPLSFLDQSGVTEISDADLRVLDLIGYDLVEVPEPTSALLAMIAACCLALRPWRARKK